VLVITREMLVQRLLELPALASAYADQEPWFNDRLVSWVEAVEAALIRLRHPMAGHIAVQRSTLTAAIAGHCEAQVSGGRSRRRQLLQAASLSTMQEVESSLQKVVAEADVRLDATREKMVQLLAVSSVGRPIPVPDGKSREEWLTRVWRSVGENSETRGMYNYLQAATTPSDLHHLLAEVLENLLGLPSGGPTDHPGARAEPNRSGAREA
jgi:hypothetical protein